MSRESVFESTLEFFLAPLREFLEDDTVTATDRFSMHDCRAVRGFMQ